MQSGVLFDTKMGIDERDVSQIIITNYFPLSHLVGGKIKDQPGSIVTGQLRNGIFSGNIYRKIKLDSDLIYVLLLNIQDAKRDG